MAILKNKILNIKEMKPEHRDGCLWHTFKVGQEVPKELVKLALKQGAEFEKKSEPVEVKEIKPVKEKKIKPKVEKKEKPKVEDKPEIKEVKVVEEIKPIVADKE